MRNVESYNPAHMFDSFRLFIAALVVCATAICFAQRDPTLEDGATVTARGTITLQNRGNRAFIVLRTEHSYIAIFDEKDRRTVPEIGIAMPGVDLEKYVGEVVTVKGSVMLEPASPYYYNGTLITADSIRLSNRTVLLPKNVPAVPPRAFPWTRYWVLATFSPRTHSFVYRGWGSSRVPVPDTAGLLSCGFNGAGDVLNCFCADGFVATGTGWMQGNRFVLTDKPTMEFAQFTIPEELKAPISRAVQCSKNP